ncbi:hypothetical protein XA68_12323 [Ophiocordyceps unilateralis]|uniref:Fe2OG dioxygenase domain-containing protein n=1 Tax=Ophiocordyceps unilateralis TaxID=268505 RepID=A0A2A9PQ16_OPHUN|nr:hypothetical protein XA68_12323 [Ophiocordyceps unilateralis]
MSPSALDTVQRVRCLDFSELHTDDSNKQKKFGRELVGYLSDVGFVKLINHGFTKDQLREVFQWNREFFSLPFAAKAKAAHPPEPNPHRGFSHVGQEKLSKVKDYEKGNRETFVNYDNKESFDQGPARDELYPNRWPDESDLPGFRTFMESFYERCHEVHQCILHALEVGLGLSPRFLQDLCNPNTAELRLNHYPRCEASMFSKGARRISEHTDFGTITLLFQDSVGGLEIEDQHMPGRYMAVPCEDTSEMIVNIGDCLQRWTNGKFRSASHRVVLPPGMQALAEERYSVAYFGKPARSQSVGTLPVFLREGEEPKYHNMTAWEYNQEKLTLTY